MAVKQKLPSAIATLLDQAAVAMQVPANLARAVAWVESRGNPKAQSAVGAQGVMQLMPATARELGVTQPFDAEQNISAGVAYIAKLLRKYGGNETHALAAYNWGPGHVDQAIADGKALPEQVLTYIRNVQARKAEEGGDRGAGAPFFGQFQLCLCCPHCSRDVYVHTELELLRTMGVKRT